MAQLSLIAILTENHVIGRDNQMPWHMPADLKHFKNLTTGKTIIMGRKTYESLGKALPNRRNVVISRNPDFKPNDCAVLPSLEQALLQFAHEPELMLIGGGELFSQALSFADKMYLTFIHANIEGDTYFPEWNKNEWQEISREDHPADEKHAYPFSFIELKKKNILLQSLAHEADFSNIYQVISTAKNKVWRQVNQALINLYWEIGRIVSDKVANGGWGKNVVDSLASYISSHDPNAKGFSARNIWRMKQFYETYAVHPKLSAVLTELSWSNHLHILSKTQSIEEKAFYLQLTAQKAYSARDLARLIDTGTFERTALGQQKLSATLTEFSKMLDSQKLPTALTEFSKMSLNPFKDSYVFEFLGLPDEHTEYDLRKGLLAHLRKFLLELGPDFSFLGEEYSLQVGLKDFRIDLLLHHRGLNCLVAIELKVTEFQPEYLGKLQFYLEALDQDVKKIHENPSIGILICKTRDEDVVKYALNRHMSPTLVAEYETKLIDKKILQKKLHELSVYLEIDPQE